MRFLLLALVFTSCIFAQMPIVNSLTIYPTNVAIEEGQRVQFTALATDPRNVSFTPDNLSWRVIGNGGIINANGLFTASSIYNSVTVEVRYHNKTASARVTIKESYMKVASIRITPNNAEVKSGATIKFNAQAYNRDNQPVPCNFEWKVAGGTIDRNGNYRATSSAGTYQVVATDPKTNTHGFANVQITYNQPPMPPAPKPFPGRARIEISDWKCGGSPFDAKVKANIKVFGSNIQTLKVYAFSKENGYSQLTSESCKNGDTIIINERYIRNTTDRIELRLYDSYGNVVATEYRNAD